MELSLPFPRRAEPRRLPRVAAPVRLLGGLRDGRAALRAGACAAAIVLLLAGGWLWLRNSSLVAVRHVHITGVHGAEAIEIRTALTDAARRMTTLHFEPSRLLAAVAAYPIVASLHVNTGFPHTVSIEIDTRQPVAALQSTGQRTAVAADGTVLGPALLSSSLPTIEGSVQPGPGAHLHEAGVLADVMVLGAAPRRLLGFVARVYSGPEGLTVKMRNGLLVYFGDSSRPHAKWLSLARVLSSPSSAGAWYVDVREPERPAAGIAGDSETSSSQPQASASDPTAAALAASLASAIGDGSAATTTPSESSGSASAEAESASGSPSSTEASSGSTEAGAETGGGVPSSEASSARSEGSSSAETTP